MYRSILVPLDGSSFGEHALPLAAGLARRAGAKLSLVHVHKQDVEPELPTLTPYQFEGLTATRLERRTTAEEGTYLAEVSRRLGERAPLALTTANLGGVLSTALERYVREGDGDLLVMTTHGRGALGRLWLGSVADTLVRRAGKPVLVVHAVEGEPAPLEAEPVIERVLVALDGSSLAEQVIPHAADLARLLGAKVELFSLVTPAMVAGGTFGVSPGATAGETIAGAQSYLGKIAATLGPELVVETYATAGQDPAAGICAAAALRGAGLLALATHGRSGLSRLVAGSVAERVVHNTFLPVLLLRPERTH